MAASRSTSTETVVSSNKSSNTMTTKQSASSTEGSAAAATTTGPNFSLVKSIAARCHFITLLACGPIGFIYSKELAGNLLAISLISFLVSFLLPPAGFFNHAQHLEHKLDNTAFGMYMGRNNPFLDNKEDETTAETTSTTATSKKSTKKFNNPKKKH